MKFTKDPTPNFPDIFVNKDLNYILKITINDYRQKIFTINNWDPTNTRTPETMAFYAYLQNLTTTTDTIDIDITLKNEQYYFKDKLLFSLRVV